MIMSGNRLEMKLHKFRIITTKKNHYYVCCSMLLYSISAHKFNYYYQIVFDKYIDSTWLNPEYKDIVRDLEGLSSTWIFTVIHAHQ